MFEFEFFDPARDPHTPPPTTQPPRDFITPEQLTSVRPTYWGEHCVECAMPLCFGVCTRYDARPDGKCRRFEFGIKDNEDAAFAAFPSHAEILFKPWGKLESLVYPGTIETDTARQMDADYAQRARKLAQREASEPGSVAKSEYDDIFQAGYFCTDVIADEDLGKETEAFVLQLYSHNDAPFELFFEITTLQRLVFRQSLAVSPGFNQFVVPVALSTEPYRDLARTTDVLYARLIPQGDFPAHVVILMAEFANLTPEVAEQHALTKAAPEATDDRHAPARAVPAAPAEKVKCVCWDLDNTVWDGTLIESDPAALELRPHVLDTMRELDRRGIVQMVVSKNQEEDALPVLKRLGIDELFVYRLINWNAKSDNIMKLAELLNIGLDTLAFVDDQPFERGEVGETLPCVRIYAETDVPALLDDVAFDVPVTADGSKRRLMYQEEAARRALEMGFTGTNIDFIRSCNLAVEISLPDTEAKRTRSYELVQRTNQLNLSGHRYEAAAFAEMIAGEQGTRTLCISASDRFGSYGQVGYVVVELVRDILYVREFAMSCRVMGKCVENALAAWLCSLARSMDARWVVVKGQHTERNQPVCKTFASLGFADEALFPADIVYAIEADAPIPDADAVTVVDQASAHLGREQLACARPQASGAAAAAHPSEVLAFVPHQDDEVLTLGAALANAAEATEGRVAVILCTDGRHCDTRARLADGGSCDELGDSHAYEFDIDTYGQLRDIEFVESCKALGVPESAICLPEGRMEDGNVTVDGARELIERYLRAYPDATIYTHAHIDPAVVDSAPTLTEEAHLENAHHFEHGYLCGDGLAAWVPQHRDHRLLAASALELFEAGAMRALELFVEFYHHSQFACAYPSVPLIEHFATQEAGRRLERAIDAYGLWDPDHRRFALGWHSAKNELGYVRDRLVSYGYLPARSADADAALCTDAAEASSADATVPFALQHAALAGVADELAALREQNRQLQRELGAAVTEVEHVRSSTTFRVGSAITALPRSLKDALRKE